MSRLICSSESEQLDNAKFWASLSATASVVSRSDNPFARHEEVTKEKVDIHMARRNSKRFASVAAVALAVTMAVTGCGTGSLNSAVDSDDENAVYRWRITTQQIPGTSRYDETILPFVEGVEKASNGRLIIEPFGADTLFPTGETFTSVRSGLVEMAAIFSGYWTGMDPVFGLAPGSIPGDPIMTFDEHHERTEALQPIIDEAYENFDVKSLGAFDYANPEIFMSQVPIDSLDDFKGMNVRTSGISSLYYQSLGSSAIALSAPEIYTGLQLGTIDAAEFNDYLVNGEMGLNEVTKYVIDPVLHQGIISDKELIVNPEAWESLPEDLQKIVIEVRDEVRNSSIDAYIDLNEEAKQKWVNDGVEILTLPDAEVKRSRVVAGEFLNDYKTQSDLAGRYIDGYAKVLFELGYEEFAEQLGYTG